ncbi:acetyltransferase [Erythrobacter sp.]|jgi:sugar O-acyltransferase (sialic acid O-acetyltransferase NeuD family)|uniref:acetyltransferase n=1 Tax=Erythrobacter sp. TaxID=1042 RepID=UPI002E9950E1|nr:acetyltransferase [Erythrobacter sp.]
MNDGKPIVIFGISQLADLARFYFQHDSDREVAAFTVDRDYFESDTHDGLPVVAFEEIASHYPADEFDLFLPISFKKMNAVREARFKQAKAMSYTCASYVSSKATTWPDLDIGENCFIFEDNTVQPFVTIGDNCILWSGNHIGHHTRIGSHVFITSQVVVSGACEIGNNCFLGVNATIRDETTLAPGTLVGMGAVITKDTAEDEVWLAPRSVRARVSSDRIDSLSHKSVG